jgi:UDPglucose 6-dehydrogenase
VRVAVAGLWHLGTVTAACLAEAGHDVLGVDPDEAVVGGLQAGRLPVAEPGLAELTAKHVAAGRLRFATAAAAVADREVVWVTYDTPVDEEDRADVRHVTSRVEALLPHLAPGAVVLVSSQLPVGTTRQLEEAAARAGVDAGFAYSPENLRLGTAIEVFTRPDRVVLGARRPRDRERLSALLAPITSRLEWMSVESAEMTKHALNAFLATSVAFANEVARVCEHVGADADEVARGLRTEARIGPKAYVKAGPAFAGGTLARDCVFLRDLSRGQGQATSLFGAVLESNAEHRGWAGRRLRERVGDLRGKRIALLGLTYKPGTDTLRRSSALELAAELRGAGARVVAHDPAVRALPADLAWLELAPDPLAAARGAAALVVCTPWPEFRSVDGKALAAALSGGPVLDSAGFLEATLRGAGLTFLKVGKGA